MSVEGYEENTERNTGMAMNDITLVDDDLLMLHDTIDGASLTSFDPDTGRVLTEHRLDDTDLRLVRDWCERRLAARARHGEPAGEDAPARPPVSEGESAAMDTIVALLEWNGAMNVTDLIPMVEARHGSDTARDAFWMLWDTGCIDFKAGGSVNLGGEDTETGR